MFFLGKLQNICIFRKKVVTLRDFFRFCTSIGIIVDGRKGAN